MANCNGACLPALTPDGLFNLLTQLMNVMVKSTTDQHVDNPGGLDPRPDTGTERQITLKATPLPGAIHADKLPSTPEETIGATEYRQRMIRAVAIMIAESGGIPNARNVNTGGSAPGSVDRGLFQWNDKAFSWITDAEAYGPPECVSLAYYVSGHFKNWSPWTGSRGLDNSSAAYQTALATDKNRTGYAVPADDPITGIAVDAGSAIGDAADGVLPQLGKLLGVITSGSFWQRVGLGALGLVLVLVAVKLFAGGALPGVAGLVA